MVLLAGASVCAVRAAALDPIAPGVYLHRGVLEDWGATNQGDVSNSGIVVGSRCVAVIDTGGSAAVGQRLLAAVRNVTPLPVCYVINTHAHPDHVLGNSVFADAARPADQAAPQFVGHRRLPAALAARGPFYLNALKRDFGADFADGARIVPPTRLVDDTLELDLGGRRLSLRAWPTAHTDADLSVLDETSGTLFLGDLLFVDHTPVVDGRLKGWLAALAQLRGWQGIVTVVPGHGAPSRAWPAALDAEQAYLTRLQSDVRAALKAGLTLPQAVARIAPDRPDWRLLDVFHARNVTAAYAELEWED
ncbi:quinoprotein relay system zinc metallohydrolase 2 [Methylibium sp. Root1272]|uniref:quinoprotein relay system zinc metallohydrolase 2 n=1 Tax=Methylibium sp. Root1272 TaxID=1736441 RepID=UPI000A7907AB|nr:quinoprotein relay system zinc metallohydrolase 2 [Methylibium sp. Root1272]